MADVCGCKGMSMITGGGADEIKSGTGDGQNRKIWGQEESKVGRRRHIHYLLHLCSVKTVLV